MINKLYTMLIVISCCVSTVLATTMPAHRSTKLDRNTATLTAKLLLVKLRQAVGLYRIDAAELYREMQQAPAQHINAVKSRRLLEKSYINRLKNIYAAEAEQLLHDLQQRVVDKALFDKSFRQQATTLDNKNLQRNLKYVFPKIYQQARKKIYLEQRQQIVGKVFPSASEVDRLSDKELRQQLAKRIVGFQQFPVYDENLEFIQKSIIAPVIKSAQQQRDMQLKIIQVTEFDRGWLPDSFSEMIRQNLHNWIAVTRRSCKIAKVYEIFPSVEKKISQVAKTAALAKFSRYLLQLKPKIKVAELVDAMLQSPQANRTSKQSRTQLFKQLKSRTIARAITQYSAQAPIADQPALKQFLVKYASNSTSCNTSFTQVFNTNCLKIFKQARSVAITKQFKQLFPRLADLSWTPQAKAIQQYYKTNKKTYLRKPLMQPSIATEKINESQLLKETSALVKHNLNYIFANARRAIAGQDKIVETVAGKIEKSLKTPEHTGVFLQLLSTLGIGATNQPVINEAQLYNKFLKQVIKQWSASRIKLVWRPKSPRPSNINRKYLALFPDVKTKIKMLTKAMIKNHQDALKSKAAHKQNLQTVKMNFDIALIENRIVILISSPKLKTKLQFTAPADFSAYRKIDTKFFAKIAKVFELQVKQLAKSSPVKVNVAIRVHNGQIFYQFIANLRNSLRRVTEKMQSSGLDLTISDRFYKK